MTARGEEELLSGARALLSPVPWKLRPSVRALLPHPAESSERERAAVPRTREWTDESPDRTRSSLIGSRDYGYTRSYVSDASHRIAVNVCTYTRIRCAAIKGIRLNDSAQIFAGGPAVPTRSNVVAGQFGRRNPCPLSLFLLLLLLLLFIRHFSQNLFFFLPPSLFPYLSLARSSRLRETNEIGSWDQRQLHFANYILTHVLSTAIWLSDMMIATKSKYTSLWSEV